MSMVNDKLLMAYMDGELSPTEIIDLESSLSETQLRRLKSESMFESRFVNSMQEKKCPDDLWETVQGEMESYCKSEKKTGKLIKFPTKMLLFIPVAAAIILMLVLLSMRQSAPVVNGPILSSDSVKGKSLTLDIGKLFAENDIRLTLKSTENSAHDIILIGAYNHKLNGDVITTINFKCCGEPLQVMITHYDGIAAKAMLKSDSMDDFQIFTKRGDYLMAVLGDHPGQEVLSLFDNGIKKG